MQSHIDKLAEQCERKKERKAHLKSSSSFSSFSSPHTVPLMIPELPPRPGPNPYQDISPISTHASVNIIVTSSLMISPSITATLTITIPVMSDKHHVSTNQTLLGSQDERVIMNLGVRSRGRTVRSLLFLAQDVFTKIS